MSDGNRLRLKKAPPTKEEPLQTKASPVEKIRCANSRRGGTVKRNDRVGGIVLAII